VIYGIKAQAKINFILKPVGILARLDPKYRGDLLSIGYS
jgi:hypothetical protein